MGTSYFITACSTDCGKTFVASGLACALRHIGRQPLVLKPVMTGPVDAHCDAVRLCRAVRGNGLEVTLPEIERISPWRFAAPYAPDYAAMQEGRPIDFAALLRWCHAQRTEDQDVLLIEGIGGVMTPLTPEHTVRDWIAALNIPTLLVTDNRLGCVSHTLCALSALRGVGILPLAVILSETAPPQTAVPSKIVSASLVPHLGGLPLLVVEHETDEGLERRGLSPLADYLLSERRTQGRR
jgi:dethiobiotin synthetase